MLKSKFNVQYYNSNLKYSTVWHRRPNSTVCGKGSRKQSSFLSGWDTKRGGGLNWCAALRKK